LSAASISVRLIQYRYVQRYSLGMTTDTIRNGLPGCGQVLCILPDPARHGVLEKARRPISPVPVSGFPCSGDSNSLFRGRNPLLSGEQGIGIQHLDYTSENSLKIPENGVIKNKTPG